MWASRRGLAGPPPRARDATSRDRSGSEATRRPRRGSRSSRRQCPCSCRARLPLVPWFPGSASRPRQLPCRPFRSRRTSTRLRRRGRASSPASAAFDAGESYCDGALRRGRVAGTRLQRLRAGRELAAAARGPSRHRRPRRSGAAHRPRLIGRGLRAVLEERAVAGHPRQTTALDGRDPAIGGVPSPDRIASDSLRAPPTRRRRPISCRSTAGSQTIWLRGPPWSRRRVGSAAVSRGLGRIEAPGRARRPSPSRRVSRSVSRELAQCLVGARLRRHPASAQAIVAESSAGRTRVADRRTLFEL